MGLPEPTFICGLKEHQVCVITLGYYSKFLFKYLAIEPRIFLESFFWGHGCWVRVCLGGEGQGKIEWHFGGDIYLILSCACSCSWRYSYILILLWASTRDGRKHDI